MCVGGLTLIYAHKCSFSTVHATARARRLTRGKPDPPGKSVLKKTMQFCYRNPADQEGTDNLLALPHLDEPNILQSLRIRYEASEVYTNIGPILIAVNPWRPVDIYKLSILESYKSRAASKPHIFGVAMQAYDNLVAKRKAQCILIAGESGAGKTESTKKVLALLTTVGDSRTESSASIEQQIMLTNPVLEAFGNAKTLRNDNSSRFGKWISLHFNRKGSVTGANIKTVPRVKMHLADIGLCAACLSPAGRDAILTLPERSIYSKRRA